MTKRHFLFGGYTFIQEQKFKMVRLRLQKIHDELTVDIKEVELTK